MSLTPNIYKNLKWSIKPKNKINTVTVSPMNGNVSDPQIVTPAQDFNVVNINGAETSLPLARNIIPTHLRTMWNKHVVITNVGEFAKSRVECILASGERTFDSDTAIVGIPSVEITLTGKSYEVGRGGSSYSNYPSVADLRNSSFSLANWIINNKSGENDSLITDYSNNIVSMNPWVRRIIPVDLSNINSSSFPTANDILTNWCDLTQNIGQQAAGGGWSTETQGTFRNAGTVTVFPYPGQPVDAQELFAQMLALDNLSVAIVCNVVKNSDTNFTVSWVAPVRVAYCAASQAIRPIVGTTTDVDNYAFLDEISNVQVRLVAQTLNKEYTDITIGADDNGIRVDPVTNEHPFALDQSEALTLNTYHRAVGSGSGWAGQLATDILQKNYKDRYIVTLDVPASYALNNNIHVGDVETIQLQDGSWIARDGIPIYFKICNIVKRFEASQFFYTLKLLEVR